ncbi:MAG: ABC transporter permease subunit [Candidatus Wallbacteria bacterium]|nr:ABC transporter permease subunit [Candidatus Wallbacteria bacterium]
MIALLKKELRVSVREKSTWLLLASMPACFVACGLLGLNESTYAGAPRLMAADAGRQLLSYALYTQVFAVMLFVPILAATNLVREGDRKTLDVLMTTPRSGAELALAKLLSPALLALGSCLLALPLLIALPLLGGVRPWEPLAGFAAVALAALVASAGGLAAGALARTTAASVSLAALAAGFVCLATAWTGLGPRTDLVTAAFPPGIVRSIVESEGVELFGREVPLLLPALAFLPLVGSCLFFASLPALSSRFRRQALPVRATGAAALALGLALIALNIASSSSIRDLHDCGAGMALFACLVSTALVLIERLDRGGFLRTLPGSAEAESIAAGGWVRRFAASTTGLALLPVAATLPGLGILLARGLGGTGTDDPRVALVLGALAYAVAWTLLLAGASRAVACRGRTWAEPVLTAILPGALLAYGVSYRIFSHANEIVGIDPIGVLIPFVSASYDSCPHLFATGVAHTAATAGAAAVLWIFATRRRNRS